MSNPKQDGSWIKEEWHSLNNQLDEAFRIRNKTRVQVLMESGIELFKLFLIITNEMDATLPKESLQIQSLRFKPVNLIERLGFIQARPTLFHSYRQLSELMIEQEKLYVKKMIMQKNV